MNRDCDGQSVVRFRTDHNCQKSLDELIGLAKGLLADNVLHPAEVDFLITWMKANEHISTVWPANVLFSRVSRSLENGVIGDEERKELFDILQKLCGNSQLEENCPTPLPLDDPQPKIVFAGSTFCVTGKFAYGPRPEVEKLILGHGGEIAKTVTKKLTYLVVGTFSSRDWIHSSHGRKIEKAVEYRDSGDELAIISEDHFISSAFNR